MRSMTGYGRGETDHNGVKFSVELNSVNRKQSDIVINLPRDLAALEPQIRQTINENISRGRTNVVVSYHNGSSGLRKLTLDNELARSYRDAMRALQKDLDAPGEITIGAILQAPGVMRAPEEAIDSSAAWPAIERALRAAFSELIKMRERLQKAGLPISTDDERLVKEITFFADRAAVSEELTRVESHLAQFAHHH